MNNGAGKGDDDDAEPADGGAPGISISNAGGEAGATTQIRDLLAKLGRKFAEQTKRELEQEMKHDSAHRPSRGRGI